ncbi:MAG: amino acid adenylation domain-containing protein [Methylococcales bacterium]|nr:amino acid adenylation domain-containing protein [Methylococcales bacterium]
MKVLRNVLQNSLQQEQSAGINAINSVSAEIQDPVSFVDILRTRAIQTPDHLAYVFLQDGETEGARLCYAELDKKARAIAATIQKVCQSGDRILLLYPAGLDYLCTFYACQYANVISIPAYPPRNKRHLPRLQSIISDAKAQVVLTTTGIVSDLERLFSNAPELSSLQWITTNDIDDALSESWEDPVLTKDTVAFLQYTSGSTSAPKGVELTHGNLVYNQYMLRHMRYWNEQSNRVDVEDNVTIVSWLPLFHDMGLGLVLQGVYLGVPCVIMAPVSFIQQPARWLKAISHYGAKTSGAPNFAYDLCVRKVTEEQCQGLDLSTWTMAFNGAEPVHHVTLKRFAEKFAPYGFRSQAAYPCYGLAEATVGVTGGVVSAEPVIRSFDGEALTRHQVIAVDESDDNALTSVGCGFIWEKQELIIVDPETCQPCDADRVGQIWLQSDSVGKGYWQREDATKEAFDAHLSDGRGPYLRSGDMGFMFDGQLFVTGRLKDMVIIRGRNHYPQDIERTVETAYNSNDNDQSFISVGGCAVFSVEIDGKEELILAAEVDRHYQLVCIRQAKLMAQNSAEGKILSKKVPEVDPKKDKWDVDPEDVISAIRRNVTELHDLHVHTVMLLKMGGLPKTSSGKVQRHKCKTSFLEGVLPTVWISALSLTQDETGDNAPANLDAHLSVEMIMAQEEAKRPVWLEGKLAQSIASELYLPAHELDPGKSLNTYGLDSLTAVEFGHRLEMELGVIISEVDLLEGLTLRGLSSKILKQIDSPDSEKIIPLLSVDATKEQYSLSHGQKSLWFLQELAPESRAYNVCFSAKVNSTIEIDALQKSFQEIVNRHPSLRTTYGAEKGEPVQKIQPQMSVFFTQEDVSDWSATEITDRLNRDATRPFDLLKGPLLRVSLLTQSDDLHYLLLSVHHVAIDLWSLMVVMDELQALYPAIKDNRDPNLPQLPFKYIDYVDWQDRTLKSEEGERLWQYWRKQLHACHPALDLPTDHARPAIQTYKGAAEAFALDDETTQKLKTLAQNQGCTLFMTLLATFQLLLHRYTGQEDILVGTPVAGRRRAGLESLVGYFVDSVVLRSQLTQQVNFTDYLTLVRETVLGALSHQEYPFSSLVERFQPVRDPSRSPLFQAMFVLQRTPQTEDGDPAGFIIGESGGTMKLGGMAMESIALQQRVAMFDLMLTMAEGDDKICGSFQYNTDLFESSTIAIMAHHFQTLVKAITDKPDQLVCDISLMAPGDKYLLLVEWNDTATQYDNAQCLHKMFESQVQKTPDSTALIFGGQRYLYWELSAKSNQLAHYLINKGIGPDVLVGLCVERSIEMVIAIMGVLKAGGAYVPIDPEYPQDRISYMIEDAQLAALLTQEKLVDELQLKQDQIILFDKDWDLISKQSDEEPNTAVTQDNLAYVIYTSGSTGRPKGVMIPHKAIANHMSWMQDEFKLTTEDAVFQKTPFSFDASVWEFFAPLLFGATLVMAKPGGHRDGQYMVKTIKEFGITTLQMVPSLLRMMLETSGFDEIDSLKRVCCGGEVLGMDLQKKFYQTSQAQLYNFYGPTECTIDATYWSCIRDDNSPMIPIGRPISNTKIYLLDKALNPVPVGVPGEIHIAGAGLARGYLHKPELTDERFIADPFSDDESSRLYKTGDLGRYLHNANIEYLGRIDHQVKLRGYRIELGEIESVLVDHEMIKESVVIAREDTKGHQRLVAYVVADLYEDVLEENEVREHLKQTLPDYMIPSDFVFLDAFPLSPSGKVDRFALPAPSGPMMDDEYVAPNTPTELKLAEIWAEVLGAGRVGTKDNFFEFGGHSLLATQVISRIEERLAVQIPVRSIFEMPTIGGLAVVIDHEKGVNEPIRHLALERVSRKGQLPISFAQQRLWFVDKMITDGSVYNIPAVLRFIGDLDHHSLERSIHEIIFRHEVLRIKFDVDDGQPFPIVDDFEAEPLVLEQVSGDSAGQIEKNALAMAEQEAKWSFDLASGSLIRYRLLKLADEDHIFIFNMHHIVSDGWSLGVLSHELNELYQAFHAGKTSPLPALPVQYIDYAHWQKQWLEGDSLNQQIDYWKEQLSNGQVPTLDLPTDRPRPHQQSFRGAKVQQSISMELLVGLEDLSQEESASLGMTFLAAFNLLLSRYASQDDIVLGYPVANRKRTETESLIGFFVNTLAIRTDLSGEPNFRTLLTRVREICFGAFANEDVPFEKLVETMDIPRDPSRNPLFQVMFTMQNTPMEELHIPGVQTYILEVDNYTSKFDLWMSLWERSDGVIATLEYNTDLFDQETIENMMNHYQVLLQSIVNAPNKPITQLSMLSADERHNVLIDWNQTQVEQTTDLCIHQYIEKQVEKTPDAIAIVQGKQSISYRELNEKSNQLAQHLRVYDVGPDVLVGLCTPPCIEMMIALLGILKAGGAYVPIDPGYPAGRIEYMLKNSKAPVLLTVDALKAQLPSGQSKIICLDTEWESISRRSTKNLISGVTPDNLAYIIFTSGSTGNPKAAAVMHRGVCNLLHWYTREFVMNEQDKTLVISSFGFDLTQKNLFSMLWVGGQLVLPEMQHYDNILISNTIQEYKITLLNCAPSAFYPLVSNNFDRFDGLSSIRHLFLGGEPIVISKMKYWISSEDFNTEIVNSYGPTECTDISSFYRIKSPARYIDANIPIGRPNSNVELYILDDELNVMPIGVAGELCIGGTGVGRGYINDADLTAKKFVNNPFSDDPHAKIYRTGDRVRYLADGNIEYLARFDDQVKLRGLRIELGEIESILRQQSAVKDAVTIVKDERLVAYVVLETEEVKQSDLKKALRDRLPAYMVPHAFMLIDHIPLSPNGKVDRKALPEPDYTQDDEKEKVLPRNETETKIAEIWQEVLKLDQIGVYDNFFELGGHSLLATQLISRIRQTFQIEPTLQAFFDDPTISGFAIVIDNSDQQAVSVPIPTIKARPRRGKRRKDLRSKLEQLSDEELEELLKKKSLS